MIRTMGCSLAEQPFFPVSDGRRVSFITGCGTNPRFNCVHPKMGRERGGREDGC